ncbi:MAG: hypothetical protein J0L53_07175 [Spirochaetes bacterium]|nr:hypothetical protein [Spirochaetota bacterium]
MATVEEYSWKRTKTILAGRTLVNAEEISFKLKQEIEVYTDNDGNPSSWGSGEITGEGSLKVRGSEYQAILDFAAAYGYDLLKMPPLPLIIQEESPDLPTLTHVLTAIKFTEDGFSGKNKDKFYTKELPFKVVGPVQRLKA